MVRCTFSVSKKTKSYQGCNLGPYYNITGNIVVHKGPSISEHSHTPDREEVTALKFVETLNPFRFYVLFKMFPAVFSQLPDRDNFYKTVQCLCTKDMPANS